MRNNAGFSEASLSPAEAYFCIKNTKWRRCADGGARFALEAPSAEPVNKSFRQNGPKGTKENNGRRLFWRRSGKAGEPSDVSAAPG